MSRLPPHDLGAEEACISQVLLVPARLKASKLQPEHFYSRAHSTLWRGILDTHAAGREVDVTTVAATLKACGRFEEIGVTSMIAILNAAPSITDKAAQAYEAIVLDMHARRQALQIIQRAEAELYEGFDGDTSEHVQATAKALLGAIPARQSARIIRYDQGVTSLVMGAKDRKAQKLSTGLSILDAAMGGLFPGALTVIAGRPGMGKSSLAAQMCGAVAAQGKRVLFVSLEMSGEEVFGRALAASSRVPYSQIRKGEITMEDTVRLQRGSEQIREAQRRIDVAEMFGPSIHEIRKVVTEQVAEHKELSLVAIDYLQLMRLKNPNDVVNGIQEITAGLKAMAKEFSIPILLLSQLNRGVEARDNKRPSLADLRSSGSIEQDADNVILIYRAGYYVSPKKSTGDAELDLAKCRHGEPQIVMTHWDGPSTSFSDGDKTADRWRGAAE